MCKFTIATLECGHPQEDHVDTYGCPYFQRSNLHCDRDNPNNKDRFTIKTWDREGICNRCLSLARKREEEAIEREQRKYDEQRRREAKEREEELRRGEREVLERGHRQAEEERLAEKRRRDEAREARLRQERAHEERVKEMERKSKEEYDRQVRNQMERDMEYMMKQSREEALRREQEEEEEIRRALAESARLLEEERRREEERRSQEDRISSGSRDLGEDRIESWIKSTTSNTTRNHPPTMSASPPSPPATPPKLASSPPPPPPLPNAANKSAPPPPPPPAPAPAAKAAPRPPPAPKPLTPAKEINYSLPAVGDQKIGRFRLGSRAVPIHESQDIPETPTTATKPIAPTGSAPSPMVRLGGAIPASDVPIVREIKGQVMPVPSAMEAARTGLRKPSVSRKGPPPPVPSGKDPQLEAMLAKRRAWEPEDEDTTITPPRSPSKGQSPLAGDRARRITQNEFDSKRKMGWKNADDE